MEPVKDLGRRRQSTRSTFKVLDECGDIPKTSLALRALEHVGIVNRRIHVRRECEDVSEGLEAEDAGVGYALVDEIVRDVRGHGSVVEEIGEGSQARGLSSTKDGRIRGGDGRGGWWRVASYSRRSFRLPRPKGWTWLNRGRRLGSGARGFLTREGNRIVDIQSVWWSTNFFFERLDARSRVMLDAWSDGNLWHDAQVLDGPSDLLPCHPMDPRFQVLCESGRCFEHLGAEVATDLLGRCVPPRVMLWSITTQKDLRET